MFSNTILDIQSSPKSNNYITKCEATIDDMGRSRILISAITETISNVDTLKLRLSLQKQSGSSWSTVQSWSNSSSNTDQIKLERVYNDASSGRYRVIATHTISKNGKTESEESTTSSINVK